jgi:hypothetical protein
MIRLVLAAGLILGAATPAFAGRCANGQNFAGCAGGGEGAIYNKNTGAYHSGSNTMGGYYHRPGYGNVAPGTSVEGRYGNSATKAFQQGCAWVDGRRECR